MRLDGMGAAKDVYEAGTAPGVGRRMLTLTPPTHGNLGTKKFAR